MVSESKMPGIFKMCLGISLTFMKQRAFAARNKDNDHKRHKENLTTSKENLTTPTLLRNRFACILKNLFLLIFLLFVPFVMKNFLQGNKHEAS
jgi:glycopeptide antibiotics resistance protein